MSHKKNPKINRRLFLAGTAGVTMGLPFLETFAGKSAHAATGDPYAIFFRQANGVAQANSNRGEPDLFWPKQLGALTDNSMQGQAVGELSGYKDRLSIVKGVRYGFGGSGCGHASGAVQCLTATPPTQNPGGKDTLAQGESADNRIARELNPAGREPLTLMSASNGSYLPAILSYHGDRNPRGAETSPLAVYNKILSRTMPSDPMNAPEELRRKSVNDFLREQIDGLNSRSDLSSTDRQRLDMHFTSIRDIEIQIAECSPLSPEQISAFQGIEGDHERSENRLEATEMLVDIMAFAISCGYTRSATLQVGSGNDGGRYRVDGELLPSYHQISHRIFSDGSEGPPIPGAFEKHHEIDKIHARMFRRLLDRLAQYTNQQGTLLDQGVCVWLNDLATGPGHNDSNLPFVLAGGANGFLKTGQYVDANNATNNKMLSTIINAAGVRKSGGGLVDDFGDSSLQKGLIDQMLA